MENHRTSSYIVIDKNIRLKISYNFLRLLILALLVIISRYNFLVFHSLAELFSIIIACGIFMIAWNAKDISDNNCLLFLGIAYIFVALIDVLHTLAYKGMGVFPGYDANLPTQLWIAARYMESLSLLAAPFFLKRKLVPVTVLISFIIITAAVITVIFFTGLFPDCYIEGTGLTAFKKISEYIITAILLLSWYVVYKYRDALDAKVYRYIILSIVITAASELSFTLYYDLFGIYLIIGHILKIISFYMLYKAVIETGLKEPYRLLFHNLTLNEEKLKSAVINLNNEITERKKVENEREELISKLEKALSEVKTLKGIIPICSYCKNIRDDEGYWSQLEVYIQEHSDADFSHGICPECRDKYYPGLKKNNSINDIYP